MSEQVDLPARHRRIMAIAERHPRRGVALALALDQQVSGGSPGERAWAAYTCGMAHIAWERFPEARAFVAEAMALFDAEAMALFDRLDHSDGRLRCRRAALTIEHLCGAGLSLQDAWRALAEEHEAAGDSLSAARVRMDQAAHLNVLERPDEALKLVAAITPQIDTSGTAAEQARLRRIAAIANTSAGRFAEAVQLIERAIERYQKQHLLIDVAKCWHQRAWIWQRLEHLSEVQRDLHWSLAIFQQHDLQLSTAICERDRGLVLSRLGRHNQAITATMRSRAMFTKLQRWDFAARCDLHLGIIAYYNGLFDLALACYRRAESGYDRSTIQWGVRLARRNQALALRAKGLPSAAMDLLTAIEQPACDPGDKLELAEILFEQARAQRDLGCEGEALTRIERAEALFAELGNVAAAAECHLEWGWIYLSRGDRHRAEPAFRVARGPLADRPAHHWRIDHGLARCAELRGAPFEALSYYRQASNTIAALRQSLASEHASSGLFAQAQILYNDALRLAASLDDPLVLLELIEQQRALALQRQMAAPALYFHDPVLRQQHEQLRARLQPHIQQAQPVGNTDELMLEYLELLLQARHTEPLPSEASLDTVNLPDLRSQLDTAFPTGWTALIYAICGDQLLIVTLDERGTTLDRTQLDSQLRQLLEHTTAPSYRRLTYLDAMSLLQPERQPWAELEALSQRILPESVRRSLQPERRLLLVPAGPLHLLPWAALRLEGTWLCERAILQILPGLALWPALNRRRPSGSELLLIGCSHFDGRAPDLPGVTDELRLVAEHWKGEQTHWLDTQATAANLLAQAEQQGLQQFHTVHIASHARLFAGRGLLAHIKLWDDDLLLNDVARLRLGGALVVLAVCDGAASETLAGEELLGLGRALLAAGARDVVASLWPTYDAPTHELLGLFYQGLAQGQDAAATLITAQRALARRFQPGDAADDPASSLVWGGFTLLGAGTVSG